MKNLVDEVAKTLWHFFYSENSSWEGLSDDEDGRILQKEYREKAEKLIRMILDNSRLIGRKNKMKKFNTMFDVAFTLVHECEDPDQIPTEDILDALQKRVDYLRNTASKLEFNEAFGVCDTYPEE